MNSKAHKLVAWVKIQPGPVTVKQMADGLGWGEQKVRKLAKGCLRPSINRPGGDAAVHFVTPTKVRARANSLGIAKFGSGYYHVEGDATSALRFVIRTKDDGLTLHEARALFHHDLTSPMEKLAQRKEIKVVDVEGDQIWVHVLHQQRQINRRRTNKFHARKQGVAAALEAEEPIPVPADLIVENMDKLHLEHRGVPLPMIVRFALLKHLRGWSDRRAARELRHAIRRDRTAGSIPAYHHTTLSRKLRELEEQQQIELEQWLVDQLIRTNIIEMGSLAIDSTDLKAYCSEKKIKKGGIIGAEWGMHGDWFYGYKLHVIVDSGSELPLVWELTPGNVHDIEKMDGLARLLKATQPTMRPDAFLGDAGYDGRIVKLEVEQELGCSVVTAKNPRRNKLFQWAKKQVSTMWKSWGGKFKSVQAYLNRLPQKLLTEINEAEQHSLLAELVRNLMFMDRRVAVERFFGRLRAFTMADKLVHQNPVEVGKFIRWAMISMLAFSLTMALMGVPQSHLHYGHIV